MNKYLDIMRDLVKKPLTTAIIGFVIGLIIGLPLLGWFVFPVQWKDAGFSDLRKDAQQEYLKMVIEAYAYNHDENLARLRWSQLEDVGPQVLMDIQTDPSLKPEDISNFSLMVDMPYSGSVQPVVTSEPMATLAPAEGEASATQEPKQGGLSPVLLLLVLCALLLLVGAALFYVLVLRKKPGGGSLLKPVRKVDVEATEQVVPQAYQEGHETPIAQYMTTYQLGDDLYDDSFSIDSPSGEFLGECGVGISETIGVGDPKKVTAFEVWLFDKNDIQTITKVLMSEHAFNDPAISQRLISKGEPIIVESGKQILLETATLQLEARVIDISYGKGALPDGSFFERITLELSVWPKQIA
jgi:hypothetical protein